MRALARAAVLLLALGALPVLSPGQTRAANTTVPIGANSIYGPFWFCDSAHSGVVCTITITAGDTVTWQNNTITYHTSTECDGNCGNPSPPSPIWDSGNIAPSGTYSRQFNQVGTFNYQCNIHPDQMKGQIVVEAAAPTATATASPAPSPTPRPAVGGLSIDPASPAGSGSTQLALELLAGATAAALIAAGALVARRRLSRST